MAGAATSKAIKSAPLVAGQRAIASRTVNAPANGVAVSVCSNDAASEWLAVLELDDPLPVQPRELELIEFYFADLLDKLLASGAPGDGDRRRK